MSFIIGSLVAILVLGAAHIAAAKEAKEDSIAMRNFEKGIIEHDDE